MTTDKKKLILLFGRLPNHNAFSSLGTIPGLTVWPLYPSLQYALDEGTEVFDLVETGGKQVAIGGLIGMVSASACNLALRRPFDRDLVVIPLVIAMAAIGALWGARTMFTATTMRTYLRASHNNVITAELTLHKLTDTNVLIPDVHNWDDCRHLKDQLGSSYDVTIIDIAKISDAQLIVMLKLACLAL